MPQPITQTRKTMVIRYDVALARALDCPLAGLFISQLLYWRGKGKYGDWTYKTIEEMKWETGMSRSQQDRAIRILKDVGALYVDRRGWPPKRYFRVDVVRADELRFQGEKLGKSSKKVWKSDGEVADVFAESSKSSCSSEQISITESTTESNNRYTDFLKMDPRMQSIREGSKNLTTRFTIPKSEYG